MDICMEIPRKDSNWPVQNFYIPLNIFGAMLPTYRCFCNFEMFSFRKLSFLNLFLSWTLKKQFTQNHTMCERNRKKKKPHMSKPPFKVIIQIQRVSSKEVAGHLVSVTLLQCMKNCWAAHTICNICGFPFSWKYNIYRKDGGVCEKVA